MKVGRYLLLLTGVSVSFLAGMKYASRKIKVKEVKKIEVEREVLSKFPSLMKEIQSIRGDTLILKGQRVVITGRKDLMEKLAVLDSLIKRGEQFKLVDMRYSGIMVIKN